MDFRIWARLLALFAFNSLAAPVYDAKAMNSKRDLQQILKKTAEAAEALSKTALKYIIPEVEQSGATVLKPFLRKRGAKRSIAVQQPQNTNYNWRYYNQLYQQRSTVPYMYPIYYQSSGNPYWSMPYQRSAIIYGQPYYQQTLPITSGQSSTPYQDSAIPYGQPYYQQTQPSAGVQLRTLGTNEAADFASTKESLRNFQKLISNVDSALLSFSDKSGVALNESLKGIKKDSTKHKKLTKKQAKTELKKITKTFTEFICGDLC